MDLDTTPHVDDFIDDSYSSLGKPEVIYARWMFNHFRLSAAMKYDFDVFMKDHKLFCTYKGKVYRVTGASRLGDIWLAKNYNQKDGYDKRVSIEDCTNWSDNSEGEYKGLAR